MKSHLLKRLLPLLAFIFIFTELGVRWWPGEPVKFDPLASDQTTSDIPLYHQQFISFNETRVVHAPAMSQTQDGKLIAVWYAGAREGAKDVNIFQTTIDPSDHTQSPPRAIASRLQTQTDTWRYTRKLGNPIIHTLDDGRLMLVYVSVSYGGWAASNLNVRFSDEHGQNWSTAKKLITSPFLNISTLVKGTPINFNNGDIGIPVYHEFMGKFGELLILDSQGRIKNKRRISWGRDAIQPVITALDENQAVALLRDSGEVHKRVAFSQTSDHGQHWTTPQPLALPNPNAAIALSIDNQGRLLAVFNNHEDERYDMSLAISDDDGDNWKTIHSFDQGVPAAGEKFEFSYPYLIKNSHGDFHLVYTWHKKRIRYVHFNQAWLNQFL